MRSAAPDRRSLASVAWLLCISAVCVAIAGSITAIAMAFVDLPFAIFREGGLDYGASDRPATPMQVAGNIVFAALFGALTALMWGGPAFLLTGLPLHALLRRRGWTAPPVYILLGALTAPISVSFVFVALSGALFEPERWDDMARIAPWYALAGAICAGLFGLMRRPPPTPSREAVA